MDSIFDSPAIGNVRLTLWHSCVYNAPNAGSIKLRGEWFSFCVDLSNEYEEIELTEEEAEVGRG